MYGIEFACKKMYVNYCIGRGLHSFRTCAQSYCNRSIHYNKINANHWTVLISIRRTMYKDVGEYQTLNIIFTS